MAWGPDFDTTLDDRTLLRTNDLLVTSKDSGALFLCLSLATNHGILYYEGNFDSAGPYFDHLDSLLTDSWDA